MHDARILVVEDDRDTRALIGVILRRLYQVTCVAQPDDALAAAATDSFDLFALDINLGTTTNGVDLLSNLRALPGYTHAPAVAVTAYAMPGDREHFLEAGFDCYLSKPFTKRALLDVLERALTASTC